MNTTAPRFRCLDSDCGHTFRSDSIPTGPEGCPECGSILFEELPNPTPPSPIPCDACGGHGEGHHGVGETRTCISCNGSRKALCGACCKGVAVLVGDGGEPLCAACVRETVDAESRSAEAVAGAATILFVVRYPNYAPALRDLPNAAETLRAEFVYLALTRATKLVECTFDVEEDTGRITPCTGDCGAPCAICAPPEPRRCTPPPPPPVAHVLPPLRRADPESSTWRALRATSVETVRPGAVS